MELQIETAAIDAVDEGCPTAHERVFVDAANDSVLIAFPDHTVKIQLPG